MWLDGLERASKVIHKRYGNYVIDKIQPFAGGLCFITSGTIVYYWYREDDTVVVYEREE